ncbi:MAG: SAM-dependent DNA methyltransferase [Treponema sp.]|nr:SAM-dependent DNA methyltransferase [Treponema sp.]
MTSDLREKQTTINVQEKANLIWAIADKLVGVYKPHEYGKVILPMCVIKRFSDALQETKQAVLDKNDKLNAKGIQVKDGFLKRTSGRLFYNTSKFTLEKLKSDPNNIADNFRSYLQGFSDNVIDIIQKFEFDVQVKKMEENDILYSVITEFCTAKANLHPDTVTSADMGYIFEELVRKFSESYDEQAGAHFTARDIIYLMTDILVGEDADKLRGEGITTTIYDMAMGTSQMLGCMTERLLELDENASIKCFGQELNEETFAIAKADMLIKGGDADNMKHGNTLSHDAFEGYQFDYIISNPPFGIEWKKEQPEIEKEYKKGDAGRFGVGLPPVSDGQQLFMLNGIAKLKDTGRMAIIQNGSPLFSGDAGSGQSNIRGYLLENDWLEAIIQLPNDMFYNTGIATYIWVVSKSKPEKRPGTVKLIDASKCFEKRRKSLGNKRNEFTKACIDLIIKAYLAQEGGTFEQDGKTVERKDFDRLAFKYSKVTVERPLCDESGTPILKKGKPQSDAARRDTEIIPWGTDFAAYMQKNVLPYAPDAWIDEKKTKVGYEIPFTRHFYKYVPPRKSDEIFAHLVEMNKEEEKLMKELFGE